MEGMETVGFEQVLSWKKKYENIYYLKILSNIYIYRALSREEYNILLNSTKLFGGDISDLLLNQCLLYHGFDESIFDNKSAGEVEVLSGHIMRCSGFSETEAFFDDIKKHRESLNNLESQIIILICKAFPQLTPSDINKLTYDQILRYLTISESILDVKLDIEKTEQQKTGTINFEKENQVIKGPVPNGMSSRPVKLLQKPTRGKPNK
jgi:hypothetical protein